MFSYKILLKITSPTDQVPSDFNERKNEIEDAIEKFNRKNLGRKRLSVIELSDTIIIGLETNELVKNPTREFNTFSSELKKVHLWNHFTKEKYRLFDATLLEEPKVIPREREETTYEKIFSIKSKEELEELKRKHQNILKVIDIQIEDIERNSFLD